MRAFNKAFGMIVFVLALVLLLAPGAGAAPPPQGQEGDGRAYTLQAGESLGALAHKFYGDALAWPAIVEATNARAVTDSRFRRIDDPALVQAGQEVWLPGPAEASRLLGRAVTSTALAPAPSLRPLTAEMLAEFDAHVETLRVRHQIPGAAVAVVRGNELLLAKGYGLRELGRPEPVTPETLFAAGSTTKAMTTMMVASLVDDGLLGWDRPVVEIWPEFNLSDPLATRSLRLRHLFNMSSGAARKDLVWSGAGLSPEQVMASLADLPLVTAPDASYHYNNQMVATGGYIAALAAGGEPGHLLDHYANLLAERVFRPIGMDSARLLPLTFPGDDPSLNYAAPHDITLDGQIVPTYFHADPGISPAGAVIANLLDMARFVQTQLNQGVAPNGNRVVSAANLAETWRPQTRVTDNLSYGMGWFIEDYQGVEIIWHDGDVLGSKAQLAFIPEANIGLVVLSNRLLSTGFSYSVRYHLVEMLYGLEAQKEEPFIAQWDLFLSNIAELRSRVSPTVDPAAAAPLVGQYSGSWRVELHDDNTLWAIRGPYTWRLMPFNGPSYTPARDLPPLDPEAERLEFLITNGFGIATTLLFETDPAGRVKMTFKLYSGEVGAYEKNGE